MQSISSTSDSLYGRNILSFIEEYSHYADSACKTARYLLTHGNRYPERLAIACLGIFDKVAYNFFHQHPELPVIQGLDADKEAKGFLELYINTLGRLHIRNHCNEKPTYSPNDEIHIIGLVHLSQVHCDEIKLLHSKAVASEAAWFDKIKCAMDAIQASGDMARIVGEVIDHVEHVESVCFYVGDIFLARMERFVNLVGRKGATGFLTAAAEKPYAEWTKDEVLVVAALHALFLSGRAVRFEEFNGATLSATALWHTLFRLQSQYLTVESDPQPLEGLELFELARLVRKKSEQSVGGSWLRYRWIYGLNFQKGEEVLATIDCTESPLAYRTEFGDVYNALVGMPPSPNVTESDFVTEIARACVQKDRQGVPCHLQSSAVTGWVEWWIEQIVASAVRSADADYGMSSSLRNIAALMEPDDSKLLETIHLLQAEHFFTCFVSRGFRESLEKSEADMIAESVQRRMMFNRWHFIPGNLERSAILKTRHWYYPPLLPDIAIHSDVHRAGHARAQVKFSIRSPGPDMSRPPLQLLNRKYRGFYDVRVVRMRGPEFNTDDLLRTRRRTLWLEMLYAVLCDCLERDRTVNLAISGFKPATYLDLDYTHSSNNSHDRQ